MNIVSVIEQRRQGFPVKKIEDPLYSNLVNTDTDCFPRTNSTFIPSPVFACHFCRKPSSSHLLVNVNEFGDVYVINTKSRKQTMANHHANAIFDFSWLANETAIITGSGDHLAKVWDLESSELIGVARGHERSIKCVSSKLDDPCIFATGGRDGYLIQWDLRIKDETTYVVRPDQTMLHPHQRAHPNENSNFNAKEYRRRLRLIGTDFSSSITGVVYQDEHTLISCSDLNGLIKVWDMRKTYTVHKMLPTPKAILKHPKWEGQNFTNLVVSPCQTKLYANSIDGSNYCFNIGVYTEHPIATYKGPPPCTFYTKNSVSPDGRYLSVGSIDSSVYVWNVDNPLPIVKLTGHDMEVTCVDWRPGRGEPMLATCSDDATCRVWRVDPSRHPDAGDKCSDHDDTLKGYAVKQDNVSRLKPRKKFYSCHFKKHRVASKTSINENENTDFSDIPHHLQLTPVKGQPCLTSNLPNLVIDGESPHHHVCPRSTASAHKDTDWLTKLRQSSTPPPPQSSSAGSKSERSSVGRKSSRSATARGGVVKRQRSARGNLMEFFRVAATLRDSQCGAASSAVVADDLTPPVLPTPDFCDLP